MDEAMIELETAKPLVGDLRAVYGSLRILEQRKNP